MATVLLGTGCQPALLKKKIPNAAALSSSVEPDPVARLQFGTSASEDINYATLDDDENLYVCGGTQGALGEAQAGNGDIYVTKISALGAVEWTKQLGNVTIGAGASSIDICDGLAFDSSSDSIFFSGRTFGSLVEANAGSYDLVVGKISSAGALTWVRQLGSVTMGASASAAEMARQMAIQSTGDVIVVGETSSDFGEVAAGNGDAFIASFDTNGNLNWITQLGSVTVGGAASQQQNAYSIAIDSTDNIVIGGSTLGSLAEANAGGRDAFVAYFDSGGALQWMGQLGNVTIGAGASGFDDIYSVAFDGAGDVVVAGYTNGSLAEANAGNYDIYVAKWNSAGVFQWASQLGNVTVGGAAADDDKPLAMSLDSSDNIFLAGYTGASLAEASGGSYDAIAVKLDAAGNLSWIKQFGNVTIGAGASGFDSLYGIEPLSNGQILLAGSSAGNFFETSAGSDDLIYIRLESNGDIAD